jgi:hypothetical protein
MRISTGDPPKLFRGGEKIFSEALDLCLGKN